MRAGQLLLSIARIAVFDIAGPLIIYSTLRSAGASTVTALIVSGASPALGVAVGMIAHRRVDAIGIFVLAGIALGAVIGVISHSARLVLAEGSVPTGVFGLICLGSLLTRRPLMFRLALEFMGPGSPKGREFAGLWQYEGFRRPFRNLTALWGLAYLTEAAVRIVIAAHTPVGLAFAISKVMPLAVTAVLVLWTVAYSLHHRRKGRRIAAAFEHNEVRGAGPISNTPTAASGSPPAAVPE